MKGHAVRPVVKLSSRTPVSSEANAAGVYEILGAGPDDPAPGAWTGYSGLLNSYLKVFYAQ